MSAIDLVFQELRARGQKALIPFVTAGDPNLELTQELIKRLAEHGCRICEIGLPYSDPIADGPVIQASYTRALAHHVTLAQILRMLATASANSGGLPLVSMASYAILFRHGLERFVAEARQAGLAGLIVPDLLIEEAAPLARLCTSHDLSLIQLVTPTTPPERVLRIAAASSGFLYYVSVTGITGERQELPAAVVDQVGWLRERTELPICIGFGVSRPDQVKLLRSVADGVIVGSALVRHLARCDQEDHQLVLNDMLGLVDRLLAALHSE